MTNTVTTITEAKKEKLSALFSDKSFCEKLSHAKNSEEMKKLFSEYGYTFDSDEEFEEVLDAIIEACDNYKNGAELDEGKLDNVSGGIGIIGGTLIGLGIIAVGMHYYKKAKKDINAANESKKKSGTKCVTCH